MLELPRSLPARLVLVAAFALIGAGAATAQRSTRSFDELRAALPQAQADTRLQVRLRWRTDAPTVNPAHAANTFDVTAVEAVSGAVRRDRAPNVGTTSLVVVSTDVAGGELDWRIVADPRVVRAEATGTATVTGERLYYVDTELLLQVPDLPDTSRLDLYSVRAEGGRPVLDALGTVTIR